MKRKTRFDGVDVAAMVAQIQKSLIGSKVANVYDGWTEKMYLIKLAGISADNNDSDNKNRHLLLLESGVRFHLAAQKQDSSSSNKNSMPSGFAMKLRKHLRGLRLESIKQLGSLDRVVDIRFGSGDSAYHLILELYSQGNIILTDCNYAILALLREHQYTTTETTTAEAVKVAVRQVYPVTFATTLTASTAGLLCMTTGQEAYQWAKEEILTSQEQQQLKKDDKRKKNKLPKESSTDSNKNSMVLKTLLLRKSSGVHHYGPSIIEHCILSCNIDPNMMIHIPETDDTAISTELSSLFETLLLSLRVEGANILNKFNQLQTGGGYILYTTSNSNVSHQEQHMEQGEQPDDRNFLEFLPHLLKQHQELPYNILEYETFSDAIDVFFSSMEGQLLRQRYEAAEQAARDRLCKIELDQRQRLENLQREQHILFTEAKLIEHHADVVDKALLVVNSALSNNMSWDDLDQVIQMEQSNKNPIALLIHKLDYEHDFMVLKLTNPEDNDVICLVKVTFFLTAHANAREMYNKYRQAKDKYEKTAGGMAKAMKAAESVVQKQLQDAQQKQRRLTTTAAVRKINWFEKFNWFVTSDNYLVLAGRDAHQNELLVKRYLRSGDLYLHADVHGAASCILRAKRVRRKHGEKTTTDVLPLSEIALREAGNFTICRSSAWSSKIITSAWWVESHQVSKTAPTGEYLTVGSFMVRGKKNFLPPSQLEMGMAVLFRLGDDSSIARHANERRDFALLAAGEGEDHVMMERMQDEDELLPTEKLTSSRKGSSFVEGVKSTKKDDEHHFSPSRFPHAASIDISSLELSEEEVPVQVLSEKDQISSVMSAGVKEKKESRVGNSAGTSNDNGSPEGHHMVAEEAPPLKSKKGLSVKDRKLIKKYGSLEAAEDATRKSGYNKPAEIEPVNVQVTPVSATLELPSQELKGKDVRGKKGKSKKAARKYADQDEEDKELAMIALQGGESKGKMKGTRGKKSFSSASHSAVQQQAAAETSALLRKDASEVSRAFEEEVRNILVECVTVKESVEWNKFDADVLEQMLAESKENQLAIANRLLSLAKSKTIDNFSASLSGILRTIKKYGPESFSTSNDAIRSEKKRGKEVKSEKVEWREIMAEEGIFEDGEKDDAVDDTAELSKFTGLPADEDILLYAIPICAPYSSLTKYKYRVKLTPGSLKRGKAVKQCVEMFLRGDDSKVGALPSISRTRDLIKSISENDWIQAICGDVKISAPGASRIVKIQKANSKKGAKTK